MAGPPQSPALGLRALTWYADGVEPSDPVVFGGIAEFSQKKVQNAGTAFWERYEKPLMPVSEELTGSEADVAEAERREDASLSPAEKKKRREEQREKDRQAKDGGLLKMSDELKDVDLYELLEVSSSASAEEIKKSYRRLALVHHPDKQGKQDEDSDPASDSKKEEERTALFRKIQEAYDILSEEQKRRRYDSIADFDDAIPTGFANKKEADFFETFRPVFNRNARWSTKKPVPDLGDEETPLEKVKKFYDFWVDFDTWRDPLAMAEKDGVELMNLADAEERMERRWMERENAKVARGIRQQERDRISDLVKLADKHDPRMIAERARKKAEKDAALAAKQAVIEAARMEREAKERAAEEQRLVKEAAEEAIRLAEKAEKDGVRNALKKSRQRIRTLHREARAPLRRVVHADQLQEVCVRLSKDALDALAVEVEAALKLEEDSAADGVAAEETPAAALFLAHIQKIGLTPIQDDSINPDGDSEGSTLAPDTGSDAGDVNTTMEVELAPPTEEELEAKRLADEERAEKLRKKREEQKKEEEKQAKKRRDAEAKDRKKQEKTVQADAAKKEEAQRKSEELKSKQAAEKEEAKRVAAERKVQQKSEAEEAKYDAFINGAFLADRVAKLEVVEAADNDFGLRSLLFGSSVAATLRGALRTLRGDDFLFRDGATEQTVDLGLACIVRAGLNGDLEGDVRELALAFSLAVRAPLDSPSLEKEVKARVKKQRLRIRDAFSKTLFGEIRGPKGCEEADEKAFAGSSPFAKSLWKTVAAEKFAEEKLLEVLEECFYAGFNEDAVWAAEEERIQQAEEAKKLEATSKKGKKGGKSLGGEDDIDALLAGIEAAPKGGGGAKKKKSTKK